MHRPALPLLLALCVATAGCSVLGPDHTREERAEAALDRAQDAVADAGTYRYEVDVEIVAETDDRTERIAADVSGAVDLDRQRLRTEATVDDRNQAAYQIGQTRYQNCPSPWGWRVTERDDEGNWSSATPVTRQLALLESGSLYWNGTDAVDGRNATLLVGEPTEEALTQYQEERSSSLLGGPSAENVRMRLWLDPDSGRPIASSLRFDVSGRDGTATATLRASYGEYGEPVSITVPEEARDGLRGPCPGS